MIKSITFWYYFSILSFFVYHLFCRKVHRYSSKLFKYHFSYIYTYFHWYIFKFSTHKFSLLSYHPVKKHDSNYIIRSHHAQSHMPRIPKAIHAFWQKIRIQRECNSLLLQNSNLGTIDCHWWFTSKWELPPKSVNCSQNGCLHLGNSMAKPCTTKIDSRWLAKNIELAWNRSEILDIFYYIYL